MRILAIISVLLLTGCSGTIPVKYQSQSLLKIGSGEVVIGDFHYLPADEGLVRADQIQNKAIGKTYVPTEVATLVRRATASEFERAGVTRSNDANYEITGDVIIFEADDWGLTVEWNYKIRYKFNDRRNGAMLIDKVYESKQVKTPKVGGYQALPITINELILDSLEQFMSDVLDLGVY